MAVKKKVVEIDTLQAQTSVKDLRMQLKELRSTMLNCEEGTEEYNKALTQAAEITHTLKEQTEFINATAMDFGLIASNVTSAIGGMVGGLQAAKAAMSLFGVENEEVLKSLQKMQSLMAITQALPAIDKGVKAFKKLSIAIKAATGATHGFKAALVSTGIGAAVVALGLLIANWDKVTAAMQKWGIIHKTTAEKLEEEKKKAEELRGKLDEARQAYQDWEKQNKISNLSSEAKQQYDDLQNTIDGAILKLKEFDAALAAETNKEKWEALRDQAREYETIRDNAAAAQRAILESADATKEAEEAAKRQAEAVKKADEEMKKLKDAYASLAEEISLYGKTDEEKDIYKLNKEEEEKKSIVEQAWKKRIITEEEYQKQLTQITEQYETLRTDVTAKYVKERADKADQEEQERLAKIKEGVEKALAAIEYGYGQQILLISEKELELSEQYKNGGLSSEEYAEALKLSQEEQLQSYIDMLTKELEVENITADEKLAIQQRLTDAKIQLNELQVQNAEDAANREIDKWMTAAGAIGNIFNSLGDVMEEGSKEQKAMQIMGATINMLAGIAAAVAGAFTTHSGPWDIALAAIQATAIAASGAATIAKMSKTNKKNASGSASSAKTSASALSSIVAPVQYTQDVQGAAIEGSIKDQKVYVVESDITDAQRKVSVAESEAQY